MDDKIKQLANDCLTMTLHGSIPTRTTMELAQAIVNEPIDSVEQRGLVVMSALVNFVDWCDKPICLLSKKERGKMVLDFLSQHSKEKNHFLQAESIAKRLAIPFKPNGEQVLEDVHSVSKKIVDFLGFDTKLEDVQEDVESIAGMIIEDLGDKILD